MRKHLVTKTLELMEKDKDIYFLTGDLGFGSFEIIQERFPDRFLNMGIAEQNMIGTSCGLALSGKKVIVYSIANFSTLRVIEQIRNYPIYHDCQVLIVNGGAAFSYGQLGYTHHAVEDVSIVKSLPQMSVFAPYDKLSVEHAIDTWYSSKQTAYLRLEKGEVEIVDEHSLENFGTIIGKKNVQNYIIGYGTIIEEAILAKAVLNAENIDVSVVILNQLKELDTTIYNLVDGAKKVLFLEENSTQGGMGEHFFATCMINNIKINQVRICGVKNYISKTIGDQKYLRDIHQITSNQVVEFFRQDNA